MWEGGTLRCLGWDVEGAETALAIRAMELHCSLEIAPEVPGGVAMFSEFSPFVLLYSVRSGSFFRFFPVGTNLGE